MTVQVFDGHNDVLLRLKLEELETAADDFVEGDGKRNGGAAVSSPVNNPVFTQNVV